MPSDPDHVLDAIDGVVDEWLAMSEDSMRWAPPEKTPPKRRLALPAPPLPWGPDDFLHEIGSLLGTRAHTVADVVTEAFRPLGEGLTGAFTAFLDSPAVRQLIDLAGPAGDQASPGTAEERAERGDPRPAPPPVPPSAPPPQEHP
ncbi:hypothetical protein [Streptosporangium sp. NPDC087985]|uniref:hypothetical protein n=1 Tax=Streptosporangium sp. NPDC087985 TaxID=3366196 RepID=UPI0038263494